jgi:hypothetical protein
MASSSSESWRSISTPYGKGTLQEYREDEFLVIRLPYGILYSLLSQFRSQKDDLSVSTQPSTLPSNEDILKAAQLMYSSSNIRTADLGYWSSNISEQRTRLKHHISSSSEYENAIDVIFHPNIQMLQQSLRSKLVSSSKIEVSLKTNAKVQLSVLNVLSMSIPTLTRIVTDEKVQEMFGKCTENSKREYSKVLSTHSIWKSTYISPRRLSPSSVASPINVTVKPFHVDEFISTANSLLISKQKQLEQVIEDRKRVIEQQKVEQEANHSKEETILVSKLSSIQLQGTIAGIERGKEVIATIRQNAAQDSDAYAEQLLTEELNAQNEAMIEEEILMNVSTPKKQIIDEHHDHDDDEGEMEKEDGDVEEGEVAEDEVNEEEEHDDDNDDNVSEGEVTDNN